MIDRIRLEMSVAAVSRWTRALLVVFVASLVLSFWNAYAQLAPADSALKQSVAFDVVAEEGLDEWLAESPDATDFRELAAVTAPGRGVNHALAVLGSLGPLLGVMWGASLVGGEYASRTVRTKAAHGGWAAALGAKAAVVGVAFALLACAAALVGLLAQPVLTSFARSAYPWIGSITTNPVKPWLPQLIVVAGNGILFTLLGMALAAAMRGTAGALVTGLAFILFVQAPLGWWWLPENAFGVLLTRAIVYPAGGLIGATPMLPRSGPAWDGYPIAVVAMWFALLAAALWQIGRRQEIP